MPHFHRVTAADVAHAAGVSRATVSYVLNETPNRRIPAATRERVLRAAETLNYVPSSAARALRRGRGDTVLAVVSDWPFSAALSAVVDELGRAFETAGLSLLVRRQRDGQSLSALWRDVSPAAVVSYDPIGENDVRAMREAGILAVSGALSMASQDRIGRLQVEHLFGRGHRRIGYAAATDARVAGLLDRRLFGARETARRRRLPALRIATVDLVLPQAVEALDRWRTARAPVTAVAAFNDEYALMVLAAARELGLAVPGDLAVIGCDDEPVSAFAHPPLTTVDQHERDLARHFARGVIARLRGQQAPDEAPPQATLVLRSST